jgi:hypothetical protein
VIAPGIHTLPLWFLVFSLFLPRIALAVAWFGGTLATFSLPSLAPLRLSWQVQASLLVLIPLLFWVLLPRVIMLYLIFEDLGLSTWLLIHFLAALIVWSRSATYRSQHKWRDDF